MSGQLWSGTLFLPLEIKEQNEQRRGVICPKMARRALWDGAVPNTFWVIGKQLF